MRVGILPWTRVSLLQEKSLVETNCTRLDYPAPRSAANRPKFLAYLTLRIVRMVSSSASVPYICGEDVSMRAAIDRILKQPTLVGMNAPTPRETAHVERMQMSMAVKRSTQARLTSKVQYSKALTGDNAHPLIYRTRMPERQYQNISVTPQ